MFNFGILWINARNLNYIKKFNPRKAIRLADNKQKTKVFLAERGIPFAETYALIRNRKELSACDFSAFPNKTFVLKPNHGSKGRGILIVSQEAEGFRIGEALFTEAELKLQCTDILDGEYSMTHDDSILVEEKLTPWEKFKAFCKHGLADIRIIVFNLVPVAAMIRIPTIKSNGKANINAGGIGCGIDIKSGKVFSTYANGKLYKKQFPLESKAYQGEKIPFRDELLFLSSKIQYFVNIGYLALDWVVTEDGPKLLEINARAGLEIQKISDIRLKNILHKIEDLHIQDPQQGVEIAKTLFWKERTHQQESSKILYLDQRGVLTVKDQDVIEEWDIGVHVDLSKQKNYISPDLYTKIQHVQQSLHIELPENSISLHQLDFLPSDKLQNSVILGRKVAENFLIKPQKKQQTVNIINPEVLIESELIALHQLDDSIDLLHKRLNLTAKLRPQNYLNELDNFIIRWGNYAPVFSYNFPDEKKLQQRKDELKQLKETCSKKTLKSPLIKLFEEKLDELFVRHQLLEAYSKQDIQGIEQGNQALWGDFDEALIKLSKEKSWEREQREALGGPLRFSQIREKIEERLLALELFGIEIVENSSNLSRVSVTMGETVNINISQGVEFREKEIDAIIAHEIETHLVRYYNGLKSWWKIFSSGTGRYLKDEEGLAIWNARQKLPEEYEGLGMYKQYYLLNVARELSFKQIYDLIHTLYPHYNLEKIFKTCIRVRKGVVHNGSRTRGVVWRKNKIYLEGYEKIKKAETIDKKMFLGKIKIDDLDFIR